MNAHDAQSTLSHLNTLGGSRFASARVLHAGGTAPDRHHAQPGSPSHAACVLYLSAHPAPPDDAWLQSCVSRLSRSVIFHAASCTVSTLEEMNSCGTAL